MTDDARARPQPPTAAGSDLHAVNHAIGEAESSADRCFFERLLAPAFSMVRPDGTRFAASIRKSWRACRGAA